MNKIFLRRKEVAELLGVSIRTVDRYIFSGLIQASKKGHMVLVHAESVTIENILSIKPNFQNHI